MTPAGPASRKRRVWEFMPSAAQIGRGQQALHDLAVLQVRIDDLVDVVLVDVGVPDGLGIDHRHRPAGAAVEAPGLVHPDAARPGKLLLLDPRLAVVECLLGIVILAACLAVVALVEAEEDVALVVRVRHAAGGQEKPEAYTPSRSPGMK